MFDPSKPPPPPGTMQTMGAPASAPQFPGYGGAIPQLPGMPQGGFSGYNGGISLGGFPANPGGFPANPSMPTLPGVPGGQIPAPGGGMPVPPGGAAPTAGAFGGFGNPNVQALMEALQGYRSDIQAWRQTRPENMDRAARQAWRATRPERPDFRGLLFGTGGAPAPAPGDPATNLPGAAPQGPAGTFGTQLGVIGMTPPNDSGLPGY